jgi:glycine C-acetyltransferase
MLGEAAVAVEMAQRLLAEDILDIAFSYPVVPRGKARIRRQLSAAHPPEDLDKALQTFIRVGKSMGVLK